MTPRQELYERGIVVEGGPAADGHAIDLQCLSQEGYFVSNGKEVNGDSLGEAEEGVQSDELQSRQRVLP